MTETLSVVVPVFNEAPLVEELVLQLERELVEGLPDVEVVVVDDASTDETPQILQRLAHGRPWLHAHRMETNRGHGYSVVSGLDRTRGEWIFQLDSDGQFVVSDFQELWRRRHEADLVLGVRVRRRDPRHRIVLSHAVRVAVSLLAARRVRDANTPFRLLRRALWDDLRPSIPPEMLAPSILVVVGAVARGYRIVEVPVTHLPRRHGPSSLRSLRLIRFSLRGLDQLVRFRRAIGRTARAPHAAAGGSSR